MDSVEALVTEMRGLTPVQLERVSQLVREMTEPSRSAPATAAPPVVPQALIDRAVSNGWPLAIFTEVIGKMDEDFTRPPQPPYETLTR